MNRLRRGAALIVVMVVVVLLALAAYGFLFVMRTEYQNSSFERDIDQSRAAAMSGAESVLAWMQLSSSERRAATASDSNAGSRAAPFQAIALETDLAQQQGIAVDLESEPAWSFSVVSFVARSNESELNRTALGQTSEERAISFGVDDESMKLDVRLLVRLEQERPGHARWVLEELWALDSSDVESILSALQIVSAPSLNDSTLPASDGDRSTSGLASDWEFGQESSSEPEAVIAPDSRKVVEASTPERLSQRLQASVGAERWWGGDWDRNGSFDSWEVGRWNVAPRAATIGEKSESVELPIAAELQTGTELQSESADPATGPLRHWLTTFSADRNERFDGRPRLWLNEPDANRLAEQLRQEWPEEWVLFVLAYRRFGPTAETNGQTAVQATDPSVALWSPGATDRLTHEITDPLELVDARVSIPGEELDGETVVVSSPFESTGPDLSQVARVLLDDCSVTEAKVLEGRISLSTAPPLVLATLPGWDLETVERVIEARDRESSNPESRDSIGWIWSEGVVDLTTMKAVHSYLTLEGDVTSGQVVGFLDDLSPVYRMTGYFDGTRFPAAIVEPRTWHAWGRGFTVGQLRGQSLDSHLSTFGTAP